MLSELLVSVVYYLGFLVAGAVLGYVVGRLVLLVADKILEERVEHIYDKLKDVLEKLPPIRVGTVLSYALAIIAGVLAFMGVMSYLPSVLTPLQMKYVLNLYEVTLFVANYVILITAAVLLISSVVIFSVFFASYAYLLIEGYDKDVADLLSLLLFLAFIYIGVVASLNMLGLTTTFFQNIMGVFVILSIGLIVMEYVTKHISSNQYYENVKPFVQVFIYSIFIISSMSVLLVGYSTVSASVENIFALGFVILFALALLPVVVKSIKQLF
ncbi:MAG: hypothetical protein ACPL4C_02525 [Brevinematia bacterium]